VPMEEILEVKKKLIQNPKSNQKEEKAPNMHTYPRTWLCRPFARRWEGITNCISGEIHGNKIYEAVYVLASTEPTIRN